MKIHRVAAFSDGQKGGNPAGVVLLDTAVGESEMAKVATKVGYSETAFAARSQENPTIWRVRYFSPESEVPFCGHATIALGAVLGARFGPGSYRLALNDAEISVDAIPNEYGMAATLTSPLTRSRAAHQGEVKEALALFGLSDTNLDSRLPPARIHAGADHLLLALKDRKTLASMRYALDDGRAMMRHNGLVTIMLAYIRTSQNFSVRNAFASGGVVEDPATGAAAAALAGYLRDLGWPHNGRITVRQGEDMGAPSVIEVALGDTPGAPVFVSGQTHEIDA